MKKLLKLALALTMTTLAGFASLNITAQPAEAINCFRKFMGCSYIGTFLTEDGYYECCTYGCPDGSTIQGACGIAWA